MASRLSIDSELLRLLHERVLRGDQEAREAMAGHLMFRAAHDLHRKKPRLDPAIVQDGVEDAVLDYLAHPDTYDLSKSDLMWFLKYASERNIANALRSEARRRVREASWGVIQSEVIERRGVTNDLSTVEWDLSVVARLSDDLSDRHWTMLEPYFGSTARSHGGRPPDAPRAILNAVLWVLRHQARWHDLPNRYPPYQTCHRRFRTWSRAGLLKSVLHRLAVDLRHWKHVGPTSKTSRR